MICTACGHPNPEAALRCEECDDWLDDESRPGGVATADGPVPGGSTSRFPAPAARSPTTAEDTETAEPLESLVTVPLGSRERAAPTCPSCEREVGGDWRFCKSCGPCGAGQGNCRNDSECVGDLRCVEDVGSDFGFFTETNVCLPPD